MALSAVLPSLRPDALVISGTVKPTNTVLHVRCKVLQLCQPAVWHKNRCKLEGNKHTIDRLVADSTDQIMSCQDVSHLVITTNLKHTAPTTK